ncbi:MAG: PEP-CTERM sorting domain-containing protein [Coleofasciculaceae cyanobacterium SM2_1_6]|nr:PEP-CTERM sorting domain-containing protein [Coleofasciculaceae cyanobacterium SM2_1_6]
MSLLGFSSDGGNTLISEFNSPEGTTAYASLYGKIQAIGSIAPPPAPSPAPIPPSPEPIVIIPAPEPTVIPPIEIPPVEAPWETPPSVPEPQTMLGMIFGLGFLVRTRLKQRSRGQ